MKGLLTLAMVLIVYAISVKEGHTNGEVRAITFSALIIGNVCLILTNLSKTRSFTQVFTERNLPVKLIIFLALLILIMVIRIPSLQLIFSFEFPGYAHFISSLTGAFLLLLVFEGIKYFKHLTKQNRIRTIN
jgi:Ca2+-transporting ATPase